MPSTVSHALAAVLIAAACCGPALAGDPSAEELARDLVDAVGAEDRATPLAGEVLRRAGSGGGDGLGAWSRGVIERALERAGDAGAETEFGRPGLAPAPLPAERHAPRVATGRPNTAAVLVFMSLSVPAASWRAWAGEAARLGAPLVLRGVGPGGFRGLAGELPGRLGGHGAGVAIDPRLFRLFGIERVPAVVVAPGGVPPCASRGCTDDAAPPHDRVAGNIGLAAALEAVAAEGDAGRAVAAAHLERMGGDGR